MAVSLTEVGLKAISNCPALGLAHSTAPDDLCVLQLRQSFHTYQIVILMPSCPCMMVAKTAKSRKNTPESDKTRQQRARKKNIHKAQRTTNLNANY